MAGKEARYFSSNKFRADMKKVGSQSRPFGNSTPSAVVNQKIIQAKSNSKKTA